MAYFASDYLSRRLSRYIKEKQTLNNAVLLTLSLFFYYWCSGKFILVLAASVLMNMLLGRSISSSSRRKVLLTLGIVVNLAVLVYFKYYNFFYDQLSLMMAGTFQIHMKPHSFIFLPVGISFYTFMAVSYLVEVYQNKEKSAGLLHFSTYLTLFPHLVAGPIVRYSELESELRDRKVTVQLLFNGIWRFSMGMGKKVILANSLGSVADKIFNLPTSELSTALAWVGIISYTLQIYLDFSGYSDMAIGLASFFGFHFPENFNQPYQAKNVTEFWRRWHMTLSRWFKDYLYIGLGGNRKGPARTYLNLFIVFSLCGLWHGASWSFVIWGVYHGSLLVVERLLNDRFGFRPRGIGGNALMLLLIMIGWVFFRSPSFDSAGDFLMALFGAAQLSGHQYFTLGYYLDAGMLTYLLIGCLIALIPYEKVRLLFNRMEPYKLALAKGTASAFVIFYAVLMLSKTQFTPFIYFQF